MIIKAKLEEWRRHLEHERDGEVLEKEEFMAGRDEGMDVFPPPE